MIEHVRKVVAQLDGVAVLIASTAVGVGLAWGFDLHLMAELADTQVNQWLDYVASGFAVGAGAGFLADISGRSGGVALEAIELSTGDRIEYRSDEI